MALIQAYLAIGVIIGTAIVVRCAPRSIACGQGWFNVIAGSCYCILNFAALWPWHVWQAFRGEDNG